MRLLDVASVRLTLRMVMGPAVAFRTASAFPLKLADMPCRFVAEPVMRMMAPDTGPTVIAVLVRSVAPATDWIPYWYDHRLPTR